MFWLYQWMDEGGITSMKKARRRLKDPRQVALLQERAAAVPFTTEPLDSPADGLDLLGGRGVDLSGELDCFAWECRKAQVDRLLARAWHYFDRVVVVGPGAHRVSGELEGEPGEEQLARLLSDIQLLLYLREVGAEPLLVFRQKPPACEIHVAEHAHEAGLDQALERLDALAETIALEAEIGTEMHEDHLHYSFVHPRFEHTVWGTVRPENEDLRLAVSRSVLRRYMAHLTSDVQTARALSLPLASTIQVHGDFLGFGQTAPSAAEVMFDLRLPVVEGVDIRRLLELREAEGEYFERFRQALRLAAEERLKASETDSGAVADEIRREVIEPAISEINVRLRAASDTMRAKTRLTTSLSAMLTACGVYFKEPTVIGAGLAAAGASVQAQMKREDDLGQIRLSNMFFLWQAEGHGHRGGRLSGSETDPVEDAGKGTDALPDSFIFGQRIDWDSPLRETMLYVELPFWLMVAPGPIEIKWSGVPFTVHICPMWIEVFAGEVTDSRRSQVFQGPWEPGFSLSEKLAAEIEEAGAAWLMRGCKTVLRIQARAHEDAFVDPEEGAPPAAWSEHETYWASLCEAHIPVINELVQRYRLATYDFFAYEVSPWDVAVWYLKHNEEGFRTVLLPYKTWDVKPITTEFGKEGEPPKVEPFEFAGAADLEGMSSSTASAGEFDLLDARSLMERGDYSGAVRRTVTAIEAVLESAMLIALRKKYGEPEAAERLQKTANDFPGRVRQWLKLAKPAIGQERFDKFEETRTLRHEIVHRGRRLTQLERHLAQRLVDTGRWLYNEIESKPERKALREFSKHSVLRSVGRSALTVRFPSTLDGEGITLGPLSLPSPPDPPGS